ncbi:DgyrCDS1194 [Dimorphilus gyrociliatus]|uniref:DgyrCDS1194 n=1 Tax=Dimorphilus gyrociliatus TaxID=2664684 RepID=A0A7I8V7Z8_9ANNE|nr:DgyrCDS1194 [Dimorphilus gyrociliatus]
MYRRPVRSARIKKNKARNVATQYKRKDEMSFEINDRHKMTTNRKLINPEAEEISKEEEEEEDLVEENDEYEGFVSESEDEFGQPRENELPKVRSAVLIRSKVPWEHRRLRKMFDRRCMFPIRPRPEFKEIEENNETEDVTQRVEVADLRERINRNAQEKTKEPLPIRDNSRNEEEKTIEQDVQVKRETKDLEDELDFEEELLGDFDFTKMSETQSVD